MRFSKYTSSTLFGRNIPLLNLKVNEDLVFNYIDFNFEVQYKCIGKTQSLLIIVFLIYYKTRLYI